MKNFRFFNFLLLIITSFLFFSTVSFSKDCILRKFTEVNEDLCKEGRIEPDFCDYFWPGWWFWTMDPDNCWGIYNDCTGNYAITTMSYCMWWPGFMHGWSLGGFFTCGWQYPRDPSSVSSNQVVYDANLFWGNNNYISEVLWDLDIGHVGDNCNMISPDDPRDTMVFKKPGDPTKRAHVEYYSIVSDKYASLLPENIVEVKCTQLHWSTPGQDDWFGNEAEFLNTGDSAIENFYFGVYIDPDLKEDDIEGIHGAGYNVACYNEELQVAYVYHPDHEEYAVVGVQFLSEPPSSVIISIGYHDTGSFCDEWLYNRISENEIEPDQMTPEDRRIIMAVGPGTLESGATYYFAYSFVMGTSLDHFFQNAQNAWYVYHGFSLPEEEEEEEAELEPENFYELKAYPNPATEYITFDKLPAHTEVEIYTIEGVFLKRFNTLLRHSVTWELDNFFNKKVSSGVYVVSFRCEEHTKVIRVVVKR